MRFCASGIFTASSMRSASGARRRFAHALVLHQHFGQLCAHFHIGVERSHRGLEKSSRFRGRGIRFRRPSLRLRISRPSNFYRALRTPVFASKPIMAKAVCDLPEPDSPTMPSVSPCCKSKFNLFTAVMLPFRVEGHLQILYV